MDEIIHLGEYWDDNGLRARRKEIMEAGAEASRCFGRAHRFLKAAQAVYDDWETLNRQAMDYGLANQKAASLMDEILNHRPVASRPGRDRHLFASAITPDGLMNYVETIVGPLPRKYVIPGEPGTGKSYLLKKVAQAALERRLDVELHHCPLNPDKVEHVLIPAMGVAFTRSIEPHMWRPAHEDIIADMNECLEPRWVERNRSAMADCGRLFGQLFAQAIACIHDAKASHDLMEAYYSPAWTSRRSPGCASIPWSASRPARPARSSSATPACPSPPRSRAPRGTQQDAAERPVGTPAAPLQVKVGRPPATGSASYRTEAASVEAKTLLAFLTSETRTGRAVLARRADPPKAKAGQLVRRYPAALSGHPEAAPMLLVPCASDKVPTLAVDHRHQWIRPHLAAPRHGSRPDTDT